MRKQFLENGKVKDLPVSSKHNDLIIKIEQTNSLVDFYKLKEEILLKLRGT